MKLYYAAGTCSLSPHIVAREAEIDLELETVDIRKNPHITATGADFKKINANGYVPALRLDDGSLLTEGVAIVQYLADLKPEAGLAPAPGTPERYRLLSWLNFIASELHKMYSPWLFHPEYGTQAQEVARMKISERLAIIEKHFATVGPYLLGDRFTVADAYLFTVVRWSGSTGIDISDLPRLRGFMDRAESRPKVREALQAENLKVSS